MGNKKSKKLITTGDVGKKILAFLVMAIVVVFSVVGYRALRQSGAEGDCTKQTPIRMLISESEPDKYSRLIVSDSVYGFPTRRSYATSSPLLPGEYEVYSIASDDHFEQRSSAPDKDNEYQPHEEYYISINGVKTPNHSTDFTDYYDWRGSKLVQDDDNHINTIPAELANDPGEYLGNITVTNQAHSIEYIHTGETDANVRTNVNSVVPGSVIIKCVKNLGPSLTLTKNVDGNGDGIFHASEEIRTDGTPFVWRLVGENNGTADAINARIADAFPAGVTVENVSAEGGGTATKDGNKIVWNGDLAKNQTVTVNVTLSVSNAPAFAICDNDAYEGNVAGDNKCFNQGRIGIATPDDPNGVTDPVKASSDVTATPPASLHIVKTTDANGDGQFGKLETMPAFTNNVIWKLVASNTGGNSSPAIIDDILPDGVTGNSVAVVSGGGTATLTDNHVTWNGTLAPGATVTLSISSTIHDEASFASCDRADGTVDTMCKNTGTISIPVPGGTPTPVGTDSAVVTANIASSISVQKQVDANNDGTYSTQEVAPVDGTPFSWKLVLKNNSAYDATGVRAVDPILTGVTYVADSASATKGTVTYVSNNLVWNGDLQAGATATITYTTKFNSKADFIACDDNTSIANSVAGDNVCVNEVVAGLADSNGSPTSILPNTANKATASVSRLLASNLSVVTLSDGIDDDDQDATQFSDTQAEDVEATTPFLWQVRGTNSGDADETDARVRAILPAGLTMVSTAATVAVAGVTGGTVAIETVTDRPAVVWTGNLPKGSMVTLTFSAVFNTKAEYETCTESTATTSCSLIGVIGKKDTSASGFSGVTLQDPAFVKTEFAPILVVEKSIDAKSDGTFEPISDKANYKENIKWRVRGLNNGNDVAVNTRIIDVFPKGTTKVTQSSANIGVTLDKATTDKVELVEDYIDGRPAIIWTGTIDKTGTVTLDYETVYNEEEDYADCLAATTVNSLCGTAAKIGYADSTNGFSQMIMADDAALVIDPLTLAVQKEVSLSATGPWTDSVGITFNEPYYYRLRLTNGGQSDVNNPAIRDALPDGVIADEIVSVTPANLGTADIVSGTRFAVFWHASKLAIGQSADVVFKARIADQNAFDACDETEQYNDTNNNICINYALGGTGTTQENFKPKTDPDPASVTVAPAPEITIDKTAEGSDSNSDYSKQEEIRYAQNFTWKIVLKNEGNLDADTVTMSDKMPVGTRFISVSTTGSNVDATYNTSTQTVGWVGSIEQGNSVTVTVQAAIDNQVAFNECDMLDDSKNDVCANSANFTYKTKSGSSVAVVRAENGPDLDIVKLIDADMDSKYQPKEKMIINRVTAWRVTVKNTGDVTAHNVRFVDPIVPGVPIQTGDIKEVSGADYGSVSLVDSNLIWQGTLPARAEVVIEYRGTFTEMQQFATCNFSDGNSKDEQCLNTAKVGYIGMTNFLAESSASIFTDLPVVLAYTGQSRVQLVVLIVLPAALILFGIFTLLKRNADSMDYSGGTTTGEISSKPAIVSPTKKRKDDDEEDV